MKSQTRNGNEIKHFDFLSLAYSFPETLFSIDAQKPMCLPLASGLNRRVRKLDLGSVCFAIVSARLTGTYCQHIFSLEKLVCSKSEFNLLYLFAKTNSLSFISLYHFLVKTIVFCMWPTCLRLSSPQLFIHKATF